MPRTTEIGKWSPSRLQRYVKDTLLTDSAHLPSPLIIGELLADSIKTKYLQIKGRLVALSGLQIPVTEGNNNTTESQVRWTDEAGAMIAHVYGYVSGTEDGLYLSAGPDESASLLIDNVRSGSKLIGVTAGTVDRVVADEVGNSSFLSWSDGAGGGTGQEATQFEVGKVSVTGNGTDTADKVINHGLGRTPVGAVASTNSAVRLAAPLTSTFSSTQLTIRVKDTGGANWSTSLDIFYIVWG